MPLTVGPGSIAIMLAIGSSAPGLLGAAAVTWSIYLSCHYAERILYRLGDSGINVLLRLSAFILLRLGVQILLNGYRAIGS
jgi:multiple antibiotic resistance protein